MNRKPKSKQPAVRKPFLRGTSTDSRTLRNALGVFGLMLVMGLLYLILGSMMTWSSALLRWLTNGILILTTWLFFYQSGMSRGTGDVNQGEMCYDREQLGRTISKEERSQCYHPLKGVFIALLGCLPLLIVSIVFACITQKQYTTIGVLPSWTSALTTREEIGAPLAYYSVIEPLGLEQILRILVRILCLPWVNIFSHGGADALLTLEHFTPLILLIPAAVYAVGYLRGPDVRSEVHTSIAANTRKRQRRERKRRQQRSAAKGPERLN